MMMKHLYIALLVVLLALATGAVAQDQTAEQKKDQAKSAPAEPEDGVNSDGYNIHQTVEFGGRIFNGHGSPETYNTFVNLHSGPRLIEQSLEMHSLPGTTGQLFDRLSMSTFGFGGDPNNVGRVRIGKHKYYDFSGMFRRDKNFWDYNLFANPYNPPFPPPNIAAPATAANWPANPLINQSTHGFELVRRMTDLGLTLAPDSIVSVRLGYGHNVMEGTSFTTMHEGGDVMLLQPWGMRTNTLRFGVDFKGIPRTRISFDQSFDLYRQDTKALNMASPVGDFVTTFEGVANTPINAGVVWQPSTPCASPVVDNSVTPMQYKPTCTGYVSYTRTMPLRGRFPTSVFSVKSNYFRFLDLFFRAGYSDGEQNVSNFSESWAGLLSRTREQTFDFGGPMHIRRLSDFGDVGATAHITDNIRVNETFYWNNWREPGVWNSTESATFANNTLVAPFVPTMAGTPNLYTPATCNPGSLAGCPVHSSSSGPDLGTLVFTSNHKFDTKMNLLELEFGLTKQLGFRAGWRIRKRTWVQTDREVGTEIFYPGPTVALAARGDCAAGSGFAPDPITGVCTVAVDTNPTGELEFMPQVTDNAFVGGVWFRPVHALLLEFDTEISRADQVFTRLSPKSWDEFRFRVHYRPQTWYSFGVDVDLLRAKNDWVVGPSAPDVNHNEHNRTIGFDFSLTPREWFALDMGYNYNDFFTRTNTCYLWSITGVATPPTPTATPNDTLCAPLESEPGTFPTPEWVDASFYTNHTHSGFFNLVLKPVKRVTTTFGYTLTSNSASSTGTTGLLPVFGPFSSSTATQTTDGLNPFAPVGALGANYHLPSVLLAVDVTKRWIFKAGWNYYGYNEKFPAGFTAPRDFAANVTTLALRYSF